MHIHLHLFTMCFNVWMYRPELMLRQSFRVRGTDNQGVPGPPWTWVEDPLRVARPIWDVTIGGSEALYGRSMAGPARPGDIT